MIFGITVFIFQILPYEMHPGCIIANGFDIIYKRCIKGHSWRLNIQVRIYIIAMTTSASSRAIYQAALRERKSSDPLKRREVCEKVWLAVVEAVDSFLATKGIFIPKGDPQAHGNRREALDELGLREPSLWELRNKVSVVMDNLHGQCSYGGKDSAAHDTDLKRTVREILELTGHYEALSQESDEN